MRVGCFVGEISKLALFDANKLVYLLCVGPEVAQISALRLQPLVNALCRKQFLATDETCQKLESSAVADGHLVPHVEDVVQHAMVADTLHHEHALYLLNQIGRIPVKQNLLL